MTPPRRALPPIGDGEPSRGAVPGARRATSPATPGGARRAVETPSTRQRHQRRGWLLVGALGVALAVSVAGLYAVVGPSRTASRTTDAASSGPSASPNGSPSGSASPGDSVSAFPTPSPSPTLEPGQLDLLDTVLTVPDGWEVYADELVQDSRRLVRLREPDTDVRVQAVSLTSATGDLDQACRDLITQQSSAFGSVATSDVVAVPVAEGAAGVSCAFSGTRTSDGVPLKTEFTLLRRDSDAHTLVFRDSIPTAVPAASTVLEDLTTMECDAAELFGADVETC